jgi:hypothetical protein
VRKGGTVSVVGAYGPIFSAVKFGDAVNKGLTLRMNQCPVKRQWPRLFEHIRNGYLKPSDIVTHRIPLEHIAEGYHIFSAKLDGCIKPLIRAVGRVRGPSSMTPNADTPYTPSYRPVRETSEQLRRPHPGLGRGPRPAGPPGGAEGAVRPASLGRALGPRGAAGGEVAARAVDRARAAARRCSARPVRRKGLSGVIRRYSYARFSEARAAHWLLLVAADRVDTLESTLRSFATTRPDDPVTQTGVLSELTRGGWSSRSAQARRRPPPPDRPGARRGALGRRRVGRVRRRPQSTGPPLRQVIDVDVTQPDRA